MDSKNFDFHLANTKLNLGRYKEAIELFKKDIEDEPNNFPSYNNMGLAKINIALAEQDTECLKDAIKDLNEAIRIVKEIYKYEEGYPIAEANLKFAEEQLIKLKAREY